MRDDTGTVTLIECKLAANAEIGRAVVGQILAYASGLAGSTYEAFASSFAKSRGEPLLEAVQSTASQALDEERFRANVADTLRSGEFRLVVAVDAITAELRAIVEYLNTHLGDTVAMLAVELGYLRIHDVELLVPATYGAELAEGPGPGAQKNRWSAEAVRDAIASLPAGPPRVLVEGLWEHAAHRGAVVKGGTGTAPSAGFYYQLGDRRLSLWSLYVRPEGAAVAINLGSINGASPAAAHAAVAVLREHPALGGKLPVDDADAVTRYPEFRIVESPPRAQVAPCSPRYRRRKLAGASPCRRFPRPPPSPSRAERLARPSTAGHDHWG